MIEPPQVSYYFPAETGLEDKIRVKKIICIEKVNSCREYGLVQPLFACLFY